MKIAITQSNYIPWKGYFDNIALVDEFILYDDMQYTKRDWRNRNKIKMKQGLKWLTVPVEVKGKFRQKINETKISDKNWSINHLNILKNTYSKAKHYKSVIPFIEDLYNEAGNLNTISEINFHFLRAICDYLDINTKISFSSDYNLLAEGKTERLVDLCEQTSATKYFTGSAAKAYMDEDLFKKKDIEIEYYDYSGYKEYEQMYSDFVHGVSIIDLLFNEGENSKFYMKFYKI